MGRNVVLERALVCNTLRRATSIRTLTSMTMTLASVSFFYLSSLLFLFVSEPREIGLVLDSQVTIFNDDAVQVLDHNNGHEDPDVSEEPA